MMSKGRRASVFVEDTRTGEVFVDRSQFKYGYDPYNTVDVLRMHYAVRGSVVVARFESDAELRRR